MCPRVRARDCVFVFTACCAQLWGRVSCKILIRSSFPGAAKIEIKAFVALIAKCGTVWEVCGSAARLNLAPHSFCVISFLSYWAHIVHCFTSC